MRATPQKEEGASYAPAIDKSIAFIDFNIQESNNSFYVKNINHC